MVVAEHIVIKTLLHQDSMTILENVGPHSGSFTDESPCFPTCLQQLFFSKCPQGAFPLEPHCLLYVHVNTMKDCCFILIGGQRYECGQRDFRCVCIFACAVCVCVCVFACVHVLVCVGFMSL